MREELLKMSRQEIDRLTIIQQIESKILSQVAASEQLGVSCRHVRNLQRCYRNQGAQGLVSKRRGRASNNKLPARIRQQLSETIRHHYADFGPTLAHEKLVEQHGCTVSLSTVRGIMLEQGLWQGKKKRHHKTRQQMRTRRPCFGELVQIDGSPHDWFEGRAERCCLIVFIDDATSRLLSLHFVAQECTQGYFDAMAHHLKTQGRPIAYYSDKHGIFRVNAKEANTGSGLTQFGRACQELGIELICANSPQAKGRVERANGTLQDRLVKEMRLQNINNMAQANQWLPTFIAQYNAKFAVEASNSTNAHRQSLPTANQFNLILSQQHQRKLSWQLELSYKNVCFQIQTKTPSYTLRKAYVTVCDKQGNITILYKGKQLRYKRFDKNNRPAQPIDSKNINSHLSQHVTKTHRPKPDHPWRKNYQAA
jgi:transposase